MSNIDDQKSNASSKLMHYGMMVCCAVMLLPVAAFFLAGGSIAGLWSNVGLFAPIVLCVRAIKELLSNLVFEFSGSCGDLVGFCGFYSVFESDAGDHFGQIIKAA